MTLFSAWNSLVFRHFEVTGRYPSLLNIVGEVVSRSNPPPSVPVDPNHLYLLVF